ncbi:MAG: hypothetical protein BWY21_00307 [Parcubacteria group bacterium ADurb.Bin216]|nr:MAG: hypothetical protein BWY21_00307 [Parcubacteria group bacterium ADurb.Bin216]
MATKDWRDNSLTDGDDITSIDVVEFLSLIEQFESGVIQDVDGDTKIQVEESSDEDKIRFDTGGIERAVLDSSGLNLASGLTYNINGIAHNHDASYIAKPSTPSHLDLLAFITSDWAKVAQSWASGDLLFVNDNSGTLEWKRLPKGSDGQVLKLSSGLPSWTSDIAKSTTTFVYPFGFKCKTINKDIDEVSQALPNHNDASYITYKRGIDLTINSTLDTFFEDGYRYVFEGLHSGASSYFTCKTQLATVKYSGTATTSLYVGFADDTVVTGLQLHPTPNPAVDKHIGYLYIAGTAITTSYTELSPYMYTDYAWGQRCFIDYGDALNIGVIVNASVNPNGRTLYCNHINFNVGKTVKNPCVLSEVTSEFSGIQSIILYDNGDSVKINNDTDLIFTGKSGQPYALHSILSTEGIIAPDYEDITQFEVVSGNPIITMYNLR